MAGEREFKTAFVGRDKELGGLKKLLQNAISGRGQVALISGEAGIGKSRLVSEFRKYAKSRGVRCLWGNCIHHEISDPFLPFLTALKEINAPALVDDSQMYIQVNEAFLITEGGKVVSYASRKGANIMDEDIVGGMLAAVESFVQDAFGDDDTKAQGLDTLVYGPIRIYIEHGRLVHLAVVLSGNEPRGIREDLKRLIDIIETKYKSLILHWDGDVEKVEAIEDLLKGLTLANYKIKREITEVDIKKEKDRMFERVLQLIIESSKETPLLLILEDIHWADVSSLQLFQYIARNTRDERVCICATYRPEEIVNEVDNKVHPLKETIMRLGRDRIFVPMELSRLNDDEVNTMLALELGTPDFPFEFSNRVYSATEGNPFYVEEMLFTFRDEELISFQGGAWQFNDISKSIVPPTIRDLVSLRIGRLKGNWQDTIRHASVIGKEFDFEVLGRTMDADEKDLVTSLESLQSYNLITVDPDNDELYRFNHSLIREAVYESLGGHRKRMIHEKAAIALKDLNKGNLDDVVYKLAQHFSKTKEHEDTIKYSMMASEKALSEYAPNEAYNYLKLALSAYEQIETISQNIQKKLKIMAQLGDICYVIGEWDEALFCYFEVIKLGKKINDRKIMAKGYTSMGLLLVNRNDWENAQMNLQRALEVAGGAGDIGKLADINYHMGTLYEKQGKFEKAMDYYQESMNKANFSHDDLYLANAHLGMGRVFAQQGQTNESIIQMQRSIDILEKMNNPNDLAKAYINLGHAYFQKGDVGESITYYEKALDLTKKMGNIRLEGHALSNLGEAYIKKGEAEIAAKCLAKALIIFNKLDETFMIADIFIHYGTVYRVKADWNLAFDYFQKSLSLAGELKMPYYEGRGLFEFALMFKDKGDAQSAKGNLLKSKDIFENLNNQEMLKKIENELEAIK